jgi:hypothetical protein
MAMPGKRDTSPDLNFRQLINKAIAKDPNNPLAVFVDTNPPPHRVVDFYAMRSRQPPVPSLPMSLLMDRIRRDHGGVDPWNLLVFSITRNIILMMTGSRRQAVGLDLSHRRRVFPSIAMKHYWTSLRESISTETCRPSFLQIETSSQRACPLQPPKVSVGSNRDSRIGNVGNIGSVGKAFSVVSDSKSGARSIPAAPGALFCRFKSVVYRQRIAVFVVRTFYQIIHRLTRQPRSLSEVRILRQVFRSLQNS